MNLDVVVIEKKVTVTPSFLRINQLRTAEVNPAISVILKKPSVLAKKQVLHYHALCEVS